jgi:hypothetical protein
MPSIDFDLIWPTDQSLVTTAHSSSYIKAMDMATDNLILFNVSLLTFPNITLKTPDTQSHSRHKPPQNKPHLRVQSHIEPLNEAFSIRIGNVHWRCSPYF